MNLSNYPEMRVTTELTVADGAATSGSMRLHGNVPVGIIPTSAGSIAGTSLSFQASDDGTNWHTVDDRDLQTQYNVNITKDRFEALKWENLVGARHLRVVLSANQSGASAIIKLVATPY